MSKKQRKVLTSLKVNDILVLLFEKRSKKMKKMIFENWAKRQFKAREKTKQKIYFFESLILAQDERWRHA